VHSTPSSNPYSSKATTTAGRPAVNRVQGRSEATRARAERAGLRARATLPALLEGLDAVVSICPPGAALAVARWVRDQGFAGLYVEANAVSPGTARAIHRVVGQGFVDGGVVGPPAVKAGTTRIYLSGAQAHAVADWFSAGPLEAVVMDGGPGAASALKMAYAAYTKGLSALVLSVRALADAEAVTSTLLREWGLSQPGLAERSAQMARATAGKAWRFADEMREIAATFESTGLPGDFHRAAAEVFQRMAPLKSATDPTLDDVLRLLRPHTADVESGPAG